MASVVRETQPIAIAVCSRARGPRARQMRVVLSISMSRSCARPTCSIAAAATMSYDYESQIVWIETLHIEDHPMTHDLCATHADRSRPPQGWEPVSYTHLTLPTIYSV